MEQTQCVFLPKYLRELMLFFSKGIFVETIVSSMKGQLANIKSSNQEITWSVFEKRIMAIIHNFYDLTLSQSYLILLRGEGVTITEWTTNLITICELVAKMGGVKMSITLAFKLWSRQVVNDKWVVFKVDKPTINNQRQRFKLSDFKKTAGKNRR